MVQIRYLIATDLGSRGIDIPELKFIIHYEVPQAKEEFIHRNGRTARVRCKRNGLCFKVGQEASIARISLAKIL